MLLQHLIHFDKRCLNSPHDLQDGTVSKEGQAKALQDRAALVASIKDNKDSGAGGGTFFKILAGAGAGIADGVTLGAFGFGKQVHEAGKNRGDDKQLASQQARLKALDIQLDRTATALKNLAKAADAAKPPAGNRSETHAGRGGAKSP